MALGAGPLRTEELLQRLRHVARRSAFRYTTALADRELIERLEEAGVPSVVILSLTDPAGRNLYRVLGAFANTTLARLPTAENDIQTWSSLNLLSQLWGSGFVERLSHEPLTLTQLAGGPHGLSFHQVTRRMRRFADSGLLIAGASSGRGKRYELSAHGRRRMALIAGLGRWRHRYLLTGEPSGLTGTEMVTLLRSALPLILLPNFSGRSFELGVSSPADRYGQRTVQHLQGAIGTDGTIRCDLSPRASVDGSATGTMNTWFAALLDDNRGRMRTTGALPLVDACLKQLHKVLWKTA